MTVNNLLIVDTETTGLSPDKDAECIEIGAILYNVPNRAILMQVSTVLPVDKMGQEEVHGISLAVSKLLPFSITNTVFSDLLVSMVANADYSVAHNAMFDQKFAPAYIDIPWLCTYEDFSFAPYKKSNLVSLALSHGIAVKAAHRALTDCGLIAEIFSKRDDLESLIEAAAIRSTSPKVWVRALVDFHSKDLAKAARFEWKRESKDWRKQMKQCDLESLDFGWEIID